MLDRDQILSVLRDYKKRYGSRYGIIEIGVFGSYARGDADEESDVDVFLKLERPDLFLLSRIRLDLEELLGIPTDVIQVRRKMNRFLKKHIEEEAISA
ncbi:nucleotidyltransferase family protein [Nitratifractor salsuginis]|uniref:DNA polymerase beta domain protein region n=1 Tax=Nitratifractor salsuginis (strain DSM 16511 / JCM 12458 / E9I37-1) TaxID=749222 RepID=E6X2N6_NITSE|nr:nucleotidyltransferase domain-containing protein [Nitratifractor salsuginis]ADV46102.1 DNA polymerase beta domain protein region [Nitratifractor salsuginis DSM 16511]